MVFREIADLFHGRHSDEQRHWDTALRILQKVDPSLVLSRLSFRGRLFAKLRFLFGTETALETSLDKWKPNSSEVSKGIKAPPTQTYGEGLAFDLQVRVLEYAIQLRKAVYRRELSLSDLPESREGERERVRNKPPDGTIRDFIARTTEDAIPSKAAQDIVADYWNKLASVAWESAQLEKDGKQRKLWLERARRYMTIALEGRPNWTPGQLTQARICASEGRKDEALETLNRVLGTKTKTAVPVQQTQISDVNAIANLIVKMSIELDARTIANHLQRSYGPLSRDTVRKITETLVGKVNLRLLDDIFSRMPLAKAT